MKQGEKQTIKTDKAYYLTLTIVGWVDVFTRKIHRDEEAGLVKQPYEWVYSSASNYQEIESILEIERISQRLITY